MNIAITEKFSLIPVKSGAMSLRSLVHKETFHPGIGPLVEANILHVEQQKLRERILAAKEKFIIWDIGFGAAANAIAVIEGLRDLNSPVEIELHSFDISLEPLDFALRHSEALGYLTPHKEILSLLLAEKKAAVAQNFSWHFHPGDFRELVKSPLPSPDSIIFDPYSPATNPEMWTLENFQNIFQQLDKPCLLTNYTRSTAVRVTWLLAGFYVGIGSVIGEKAETTVAANCPSLIENPLDHTWLERVKESKNASPVRGESYSQAPISDSDYQILLAHPQLSTADEEWDITASIRL